MSLWQAGTQGILFTVLMHMCSVSTPHVKDYWYTWPTLKISHAMSGVNIQTSAVREIYAYPLWQHGGGGPRMHPRTCARTHAHTHAHTCAGAHTHTHILWVPIKTSYGCLKIGNPSDKCNRTANSLLHYVAHRPCKVFYFKNAMCFHGTNINVISIKKDSFSSQIFMKLTKVQEHALQISCTKFHPNYTTNVEITHRNSFIPHIKYCVNFVSFHGIQYRTINCCAELYPNQMQI